MFLTNFHRAQYVATTRMFFMTEKQRLWADVYRCAFIRWQASGYSSDGEWTTMVAALELGDHFWE